MNNLELSNTRFIYQEVDSNFSNFIDAIEKVDTYIGEEKSLDFFHRQVVILFKSNKFLCGREVTGFPTNITENLAFIDIKGSSLELIDANKVVNSYAQLNDYLRSIQNGSEIIKLKLKNISRIEFTSFRIG